MSILQSIVVFAVRWLVPKAAYPIIAGPLRGKRFLLGAAAGPAGGLSVHVGRSEPEQAAAIARALRKGDVFFDVGANVGFYSLLASDLVGEEGRVIAFEPVVRNIAYLQRHLDLNRARNVTVLPFACAAQAGYGFFEGGDTVATGHLAEGAARHEAPLERSMPVHIVTIDGMVRFLGVRPTVVKVDVEGAEREVLAGAADTLRTCRPQVFLSVHSEPLRLDCLELMRSNGYEATPITGSEETASEYLFTPLPC